MSDQFYINQAPRFSKAFSGDTKAEEHLLPAQAVIAKVQEQTRGRPQLGSELAKKTFQMESFTDADATQLATATQSMRTVLQGAHKSATATQLTAATIAAAYAEAPKDYLRGALRPETPLTARFESYRNVQVIGASGMPDAMQDRPTDWKLEAFEEKENQRVQSYSVAYNLLAARQDDFGETIYPTVVITPENYGYMVSINLAVVQDDIRRNINGAVDQFNRKNVAHALMDATILQDDQTRAWPVYRATGTNANTDMFLDAIAVTNMTVGNEVIPTKPLLCGKTINILGLSQSDALIQAGIFGVDDTLDSSARLSKIYMKVVSGATTEYFSFPVDKLPTSDMNGATQGNYQKMVLNFETQALKLTSSTKQVDGSASTILAALTDRTVRLRTELFGSLILGDGNINIPQAPASISTIRATDGTLVASDAGISTALANATIVGYDVIVYRTNSNRRQRGQLLDSQVYHMLYTVPLRSPISTLRPLGQSDADDAAKVAALINATHVRTSNAAVTSLLSLKETLLAYANDNDPISVPLAQRSLILGAASYLIKPYYDPIGSFDVSTRVDSLKTSDRINDLQMLLINKIRDSAARMAYTSGYLAALRVTYNGAPPPITVIIMTDPIIERYLQLQGDYRLAGDQFKYKIVSTLDTRMTGKLMITLGLDEAMNSGAPNWLHFGNMAWRPELALVMPMVRNGAQVQELTVQPSFRHITNLPLLAEMTITGIESIIGGKVALNMHSV